MQRQSYADTNNNRRAVGETGTPGAVYTADCPLCDSLSVAAEAIEAESAPAACNPEAGTGLCVAGAERDEGGLTVESDVIAAITSTTTDTTTKALIGVGPWRRIRPDALELLDPGISTPDKNTANTHWFLGFEAVV